MPERPYVVVLTGGEGTRLASLTRALYGTDLPKQFAILAGERSLLQHTIERARLLTTLDRVLVVVTGHREALAKEQLATVPGVALVVQPRNLGTGPGMLTALVRILARTPDARVIFLPADHYMADATPLAEALARTGVGKVSERVALIGAAPTAPETEYRWIVRGARIGPTGAFAITRFHEKPSQVDAEQLFRAGSLWNTFISAGPAHLFWDLARLHLPTHCAALERAGGAIGGGAEVAELEAAYGAMLPAHFGRDVLARARSLEAVLPVEETGWSDWGTPQRVFASLAGSPSHERLVDRIRGNAA